MPLQFSFQHRPSQRGDYLTVVHDRLPNGFPSHCHDYIEVSLIREGKARQMIDGTVQEIESGYVTVMHGKSTHEYLSPTPNFTVDLLMFQESECRLPSEWLYSLPGYTELFRGATAAPPIQLERKICVMVRENMRDMQRELRLHDPGWEFRCMVHLGQIIVLICRAHNKKEHAGPQSGQRLREVIRKIQLDFAQSFTIDELARSSCLSRRHFIRLFKEETGMSPGQFIISLRINEGALTLRRRPDLSMDEVARMCGFCDGNYFSRQFKQQFNVLPSAYRKAYHK